MAEEHFFWLKFFALGNGGTLPGLHSEFVDFFIPGVLYLY